MRRRFRSKQFLAHEKHADTLISVIGPGTAVIPSHKMRDTESGLRDPDGAASNIQANRTFGEECNIGDSCKYINIHIQASPRTATQTNQSANMGWIEWGFVCHKGVDPAPTKTNIGTMTLGNILTNYFREECIFTGSLPVGSASPALSEITLKIPPKKQVLRAGDEWTLFFLPRTASSTETATDSFKVITSCNYINKH